MKKKTAEDEPNAPLYRVMMVERRQPNRFPTFETETINVHTSFLVNVCFSWVIDSKLCHMLWCNVKNLSKLLKLWQCFYSDWLWNTEMHHNVGQMWLRCLSLHLHVWDVKQDSTHSQHRERRIDQDGKSWWDTTGQEVRSQELRVISQGICSTNWVSLSPGFAKANNKVPKV